MHEKRLLVTLIKTNVQETKNTEYNMKKIIFTLLVALTIVATAQAKHESKSEPKKPTTEKSAEKAVEQQNDEQPQEAADENDGDKATGKVSFTKNGVIIKKDGKDVEVNFNDMNRIISEHLDDTILNDEGLTVDVDGEHVEKMEVGSGPYNLAQDGMRLARDITKYFATAIVFIVFFSLLFYYLHRRRKYKTVDHAIQNGYPLPDEFYSKRSQRMSKQPTNVYVTQVTPPAANPNAAQEPQAAAGMPGYGQSSNPLKNITDWTPFKSGITTTAVGLGLLFFFWILGAEPLAALMLIVVFVGLGKLFTTYQEQQSLKNYWQQQQWNQTPMQPQQPQQAQQPQQPQQQWQQWGQPQQSDANMPPLPETPPEFHNQADNQ